MLTGLFVYVWPSVLWRLVTSIRYNYLRHYCCRFQLSVWVMYVTLVYVPCAPFGSRTPKLRWDIRLSYTYLSSCIGVSVDKGWQTFIWDKCEKSHSLGIRLVVKMYPKNRPIHTYHLEQVDTYTYRGTHIVWRVLKTHLRKTYTVLYYILWISLWEPNVKPLGEWTVFQ